MTYLLMSELGHAELLNSMVSDLSALEKMLKSMDDYLETKRLAFPRLYFLSMAELMDLMCKKDHKAVQVHAGQAALLAPVSVAITVSVPASD